MKVGILGGSFNPPHQGHIYISKLALQKLALNQIWWIPAIQNPLKENQSSSYEKRLQLCKEILGQKSRFKIYQSSETYSYQLMESLQKKYPKIEFFWIMGSDNLENLHKWRNYEKFISLANLAIFSREKSLIKIKKMPIWNFLKDKNPKIFFTPKLDISSTKIREKIK